MANSVRPKPKIIFEQGSPASVILDIAAYQKLLEKVEDVEDLKELRQLKKQRLNFRSLEDRLTHRQPRTS